ncbi:hypothetical protein [Escherichia coli]|uniref:hypothetical protein n=1 Tax=Escherichia coli TaxID=562 RepID=UPI0005118E03|nr:hypothetical protein [Escherichia coli]EFG1570257.1 hypothetical protein [Escherichia coli]EFL5820800.1 hypothetical protein [Escherichia coli]EFL5822309.1 hypothetical protein [Escherichia coli]EIP6825658.1 hypothetical protein [Escherichia coli]EIP6825937.1 hypothetical protein [Escherichia coli]
MLKYTIFRKIIVPYAIFKILLLIAVVPFFLCTSRMARKVIAPSVSIGFGDTGNLTLLRRLNRSSAITVEEQRQSRRTHIKPLSEAGSNYAAI